MNKKIILVAGISVLAGAALAIGSYQIIKKCKAGKFCFLTNLISKPKTHCYINDSEFSLNEEFDQNIL